MDSDQEANAFALALLMPAQWVREHWKQAAERDGNQARVNDLARTFGVTPELMLLRLQQLGIGVDVA